MDNVLYLKLVSFLMSSKENYIQGVTEQKTKGHKDSGLFSFLFNCRCPLSYLSFLYFINNPTH